MKKWRLTTRVSIVDRVEAETKVEAEAKGVNELQNGLKAMCSKDAKIVVTAARADEEKASA